MMGVDVLCLREVGVGINGNVRNLAILFLSTTSLCNDASSIVDLGYMSSCGVPLVWLSSSSISTK